MVILSLRSGGAILEFNYDDINKEAFQAPQNVFVIIMTIWDMKHYWSLSNSLHYIFSPYKSLYKYANYEVDQIMLIIVRISKVKL